MQQQQQQTVKKSVTDLSKQSPPAPQQQPQRQHQENAWSSMLDDSDEEDHVFYDPELEDMIKREQQKQTQTNALSKQPPVQQQSNVVETAPKKSQPVINEWEEQAKKITIMKKPTALDNNGVVTIVAAPTATSTIMTDKAGVPPRATATTQARTTSESNNNNNNSGAIVIEKEPSSVSANKRESPVAATATPTTAASTVAPATATVSTTATVAATTTVPTTTASSARAVLDIESVERQKEDMEKLAEQAREKKRFEEERLLEEQKLRAQERLRVLEDKIKKREEEARRKKELEEEQKRKALEEEELLKKKQREQQQRERQQQALLNDGVAGAVAVVTEGADVQPETPLSASTTTRKSKNVKSFFVPSGEDLTEVGEWKRKSKTDRKPTRVEDSDSLSSESTRRKSQTTRKRNDRSVDGETKETSSHPSTDNSSTAGKRYSKMEQTKWEDNWRGSKSKKFDDATKSQPKTIPGSSSETTSVEPASTREGVDTPVASRIDAEETVQSHSLQDKPANTLDVTELKNFKGSSVPKISFGSLDNEGLELEEDDGMDAHGITDQHLIETNEEGFIPVHQPANPSFPHNPPMLVPGYPYYGYNSYGQYVLINPMIPPYPIPAPHGVYGGTTDLHSTQYARHGKHHENTRGRHGEHEDRRPRHNKHGKQNDRRKKSEEHETSHDASALRKEDQPTTSTEDIVQDNSQPRGHYSARGSARGGARGRGRGGRGRGRVTYVPQNPDESASPAPAKIDTTRSTDEAKPITSEPVQRDDNRYRNTKATPTGSKPSTRTVKRFVKLTTEDVDNKNK